MDLPTYDPDANVILINSFPHSIEQARDFNEALAEAICDAERAAEIERSKAARAEEVRRLTVHEGWTLSPTQPDVVWKLKPGGRLEVRDLRGHDAGGRVVVPRTVRYTTSRFDVGPSHRLDMGVTLSGATGASVVCSACRKESWGMDRDNLRIVAGDAEIRTCLD